MVTAVHILAASELGWAAITFNCALLLVLVVLSATFSGSETVLFSLSRVQLERAAASSNPFRRLAAHVMDRPKYALTVILVANTAVNVLLFATSYVFFRGLAAQLGAWITPVTGVASILLVVVGGEVVPKVIGVALADRLAPYAAAVVRAVGVVAGPLGRVLDFLVAEPFVRIVLGSGSRQASADLSPDELKALLEMSRRRGGLKPIEDSFLRPIVNLSQTQVAEVMVPRVEMTAYDVNEPAAGLRDLMMRTHLKKVPVYDGQLDNLLGLIYAKVLFFNPAKPLRQLVQPVRFVPELATCDKVLEHFRQTRTQIAIALDEYGGVAGLVTLEDVLEQIVGSLHDPEDLPEEPEIVPLDDDAYEISGQLNVQYWVEAFSLPPRVERVATVGGLVMAQLGRMPRVGDVVRFGNVELRVTRLRRRGIDRLHLRLLPEEPAPQEPAA